jgi:hypothetical protein
MVQHIQGGLFRASFKLCMGDKLSEKTEGGKRNETFRVLFNVHTPIQIVFLNNVENCRSHFKNETLHKESSQDG